VHIYCRSDRLEFVKQHFKVIFIIYLSYMKLLKACSGFFIISFDICSINEKIEINFDLSLSFLINNWNK